MPDGNTRRIAGRLWRQGRQAELVGGRAPAAPLTLAHVPSAMNTIKAIYPGTFDPMTNGHLDLIARGAKIFDHLVVAVLENSQKSPLFSVPERCAMLTAAVKHMPNVSVQSFDGLLVEFVRSQQAQAILRGIRAISDYEYELQMALMNRRLAPDLETVFMMPAEKFSYVSSRLVKEIFRLGGSVDGLVPEMVLDKMKERGRE
jgi:pantetheine-phosphate adenylyltransferase